MTARGAGIAVLGVACLLAACDAPSGLPQDPDPECTRVECSESGKCRRSGGLSCIPRGDDCARTLICKLYGRCQLRQPGDTICRAGSEEDCRQSAGCLTEGQCALDSVRGACGFDSSWRGVPSCATSPGCVEEGLCAGTYPDDCTLTDAGCASSQRCRESGRCSLVGKGCTATTSAHCRSSDECHDRGRCTLLHALDTHGYNACISDSDADCRSSWGCRVRGACALGKPNILSQSSCSVVSSADCAASYRCELFGECTLAAAPGTLLARCVVGSTADCAASALCHDHGRCVMEGDPAEATSGCAK